MSLFKNLTRSALDLLIKYLSRSRLPQTDGRIYLENLSNGIKIQRDRWGIPHIHTETRKDLFFAQGFIHAQDRLWQMELNRRAATGTLAAMVGEKALQTDRLTRTLGFFRLSESAWQNTSEQVRNDVKAYTAGVNAFLNSGFKLPVEFTLLRHQPQPWSPLDSVAFGRLMAWSLSHVWNGKLVRAQIIEKVGTKMAGELELSFNEQIPITLPKGIEFNILEPDGMFYATVGPFIGRAFDSGARGSNGWVVSPKKSATGSAILCNDMHLPISTPSLWYYLHFHCDDASQNLHVTGVSLPGLPYILVGHNQRIAWGATVSFIDCEDLFVERFHADDPSLYEFDGQWQSAIVCEERIEIKGKSDHVEQVVLTHHGPIISNVSPTNGQAIALQSMALQSVECFAGFPHLNLASGWDDFVEAVRMIEAPHLNLLYADIKGNIGYYASGQIPMRASGLGLIPVSGWSGKYEWVGSVPFEEKPHALNPSQGYIVSANHRIVSDDFPFYLGNSWRNGFRAKRIDDLISSQEKISIEDCFRIQLDLKSIPAIQLKDKLEELVTENPDARLAKEILYQWDGRLSPDSVGGSVYQILLDKLSRSILEPKLGFELTSKFLGSGPDPTLYPINEIHGHWPAALLKLIDDLETLWLLEVTRRSDLLIHCLSETTKELRRLLGYDPSQWQWGKLHQIRFDHAMAILEPLDQIFSQGSYPIGGDQDTIAQASIKWGSPGDNIAPSYRQVVNLGDLDSSKAMHVPGQSGHLASSHYGDLILPWFNGEYYLMLWDESSVTEQAVHTLSLLPSI